MKHMKNSRQRGSIMSTVTLMILFIAVFYLVVGEPYLKQARFDEMRAQHPEESIDYKITIDKYREKLKPQFKPKGKYVSTFMTNDKKTTVSWYFDAEGNITKEVSIAGLPRLLGTAKYHFNGSTIVYSDISGDKFLFPKSGEAITMNEASEIVALNLRRMGESDRLIRVDAQ